MLGFIFACLLLVSLQLMHTPYLDVLSTPPAQWGMMALMACSLLAGYLKKLPSIIWHDGFATGGLLFWFGYWKPEFNDDAPMFIAYPLYFAFISAVVTLTLINNSQDFDREAVVQLRYLDKLTRLDISSAIIFVVIGILVTRHYALYAMAMTFFILRHTINVCLENCEY